MNRLYSTALVYVGIALLILTTPFAAAQQVYGQNGMVVSASALASQAGIDALKKGGNAVDAAVVTGFALAVTHPSAGNIGGGGFMLGRMSDGTAFALDFREVAPQKAHRDMFLDEEGNADSELSLRSPLASGVPGSVDGLLKAWADHGSGNLTRQQILQPSITLSRKGFPLSHSLANSLNAAAERFAKHSGSAAIFIGQDPWKAGDVFRQTDLADSLERIAQQGRDGFYRGKTAKLLVDQMKRTNGLISLADLKSYTSKYRKPITGTFHDYAILSMPPPSSGGILLVHMLNILESYDLESMEWNSAAYVHLLTEVQRRAYADRAVHLGDSDFWDVPQAMLLSKDYADLRKGDISLEQATPSKSVHAGAATHPEHEETIHYSVVDAAGSAVAITTTLNVVYGSGIVVEGGGFLLNNEMDDFSSKPGTPNLYGLIGGEANAIEPGKRMLSSMTPTIVLKDDKPLIVTGSPGGSTIITTVLQVILNTTVHGMSIGDAVAAPRHHSQWLPDRIQYETHGLSPDTRAILEAKGHTLASRRSLGNANSIMATPNGLFGAGDARRSTNSAIGY